MDHVSDVKLVEREVGRQWLITSPDVPGLFVAHVDLDTARRAVPAAVETLRQMAERVRNQPKPAIDPS